ncbi:hypothetical protein EI94DRAFT_1755231 [Lactarius quietus]|nr:hypothetical protein EI94DRAFT_1755231 [Lactarius quietus]
MQSKSFSFMRRIIPASPNNNSSDNDPIGGSADIAMSAIETFLTVLKEASALTSKVPYFAPIAGIILEALKMRDEVKQLKKEWGVVMQKVAKVGSILIDVGEWYQTNEMSEGDLPSDLRNVLKSLQTDLDGIQDVMEECAKVKGIRKILLRTDILGKVKQYDAKLTHALQVFQARVALGSRLAQIVQERKVNSYVQTASSGRRAGSAPVAESRASTPSDVQVAQVFFGREVELAQIIEMIFANNGSRAARIAILGPGGYGKTTLAHAALTHPRVREHYGDARYIVKCESLLSSGALMIQLAMTLGVFKAGSDASWSRIRALLIAKECIICFDNFESPWDQPGAIKASVEEFLSRITEIHHVTIIITMRGTERPAKTQWTRPTLAPIKTLTLDAAKETWEHITDHYDDFAEKLISAVDCVPLAVNLLAHLAQGTSAALVWHDWNEKCIQLVQLGYMNRLSNLEYSIQLSIDSERMRHYSFAKNLLGILSLISDGIHIQQLKRLKGIFNHPDFLSSLQVLQRCSLINLTGERYQAHPIICLFCDTHGLLSSEYKTSLQDFYITLANHRADSKEYSEMVLEVNNTKAILSNLLNSSYSDHSKLIGVILEFTHFCIRIGDHSEALISQAVPFLKQNQGSKSLLIECLTYWGRLYYNLNDFQSAMSKLREAEEQCLSLNDQGYLYGEVLRIISNVYVEKDDLHEAEVILKKALIYLQDSSESNTTSLANTLYRLENIYDWQRKWNKAEAIYQEALKIYKATDLIMGQGYVHSGLGKIYLHQNKLDKAEAAFEKALEMNIAGNELNNQGLAYIGLGDVYFGLNKLDRAETSYKNALEFHITSNSIKNQGIDFAMLGDVYLKQDKLNDAELFFQKALKCFVDADAVSEKRQLSEALKRVHKMLEGESSLKVHS